jgi:phosphocarrier protein HPr
MIEMKATVKNANGIHCRPSAVIAKEVMNYAGDIRVIAESGTCDPRSIMALISLGLQEGAQLRIRVTGPNEAAVCRTLVALFEKHYDFPPRDPNAPPAVVLADAPFADATVSTRRLGKEQAL